jgi:hypothetical protein
VRTSLKIVGAAVAVVAFAAPPTSAAGGDVDPNACLRGFVWRDAFPGDVVCVTPQVRRQVRLDNAAAASRRDPNGAWGPNSCKSPFVWRAARPSDLVCVTVKERTQAARDNAAAASRRNSVRTRLSRWTKPDTRTCDGDVCTIAHDGTTNHLVIVENINLGRAYLGLFRPGGGRPIDYWYTTAVPAGRPGGRATFRTDRLVCAGTPNAYFRVKDMTSGRWSDRKPVRTGCHAL